MKCATVSMASLDAPSSMPILVTRRAEEEHERPSLCAELTMLLTSPDAYIAALALLVGFLTPEALPQHQRGAPRNSSGLLSNVYLDDSEQACPHAHAMHTPCTRHATRHAHATQTPRTRHAHGMHTPRARHAHGMHTPCQRHAHSMHAKARRSPRDNVCAPRMTLTLTEARRSPRDRCRSRCRG